MKTLKSIARCCTDCIPSYSLASDWTDVQPKAPKEITYEIQEFKCQSIEVDGLPEPGESYFKFNTFKHIQITHVVPDGIAVFKFNKIVWNGRSTGIEVNVYNESSGTMLFFKDRAMFKFVGGEKDIYFKNCKTRKTSQEMTYHEAEVISEDLLGK